MLTSWFSIRVIIPFTVLLFHLATISNAQTKLLGRIEIGTVLGKPVYRDEITAKHPEGIEHQLHCLFLQPLTRQYQQNHAAELAITEDEIKSVLESTVNKDRDEEDDGIPHDLTLAAIDEIEGMLPDLCGDCAAQFREFQKSLEDELQMPGRSLAKLLLKQWKQEKHFYQHFGGGRVVGQQLGYEAIDATRRWLAQEEAEGNLQIRDEELREEFFRYWDKVGRLTFLVELDDPEVIRTEFLEPEWVKPNVKTDLLKTAR